MLTIIIVEVIERLLVYNIQADNLEFGKQSIHIGLCWHVFCSPSRLPHITARDVKFLKQSWPLDWGKAYWEQLLNSQVASPSLPHPWWLHVLSTLWSKVNPRSCLFERDLPICQQLALFAPWMSAGIGGDGRRDVGGLFLALGETACMVPTAASRLKATSCEISRAGSWRACEYCAFVNIWAHLLSSLPKKPLGKPTSRSAVQCCYSALIVKSVECFSQAHKN